MADFQLPKGLRDITPEETTGSEAVRAAFVETCNLFDYKLMEPSSLELIETLEAKSGPAIKDEIYLLREKGEGGRELGLRFDLTVGITRYVASKRELSPPVRLGAFSSVWRYDNPQYGRYRWFYQWDIELFGPSNPEADAEVIEFTYKLFRRLGADPEIRLNSRKIIEDFIRSKLGISEEERILAMMRAIDKVPKKGFDEVALEYEGTIGDRDQFQMMRKLMELDSSGGSSQILSEIESEFRVETRGLATIVDGIKRRGVKDYKIDLGIVRGIDYYTDMVFEAYDRRNSSLGSLCGGGRYDSLPPIYGRPDLGATGVAGGVERAIFAYQLKSQNMNARRVFVAPIGKNPAVQEIVEKVASELRDAGLPAQSEITGRSLRKILDSQSAAGVRAVVIIGEKELGTQSANVKWMKTGDEVTVKLSELKGQLEKLNEN